MIILWNSYWLTPGYFDYVMKIGLLRPSSILLLSYISVIVVLPKMSEVVRSVIKFSFAPDTMLICIFANVDLTSNFNNSLACLFLGFSMLLTWKHFLNCSYHLDCLFFSYNCTFVKIIHSTEVQNLHKCLTWKVHFLCIPSISMRFKFFDSRSFFSEQFQFFLLEFISFIFCVFNVMYLKLFLNIFYCCISIKNFTYHARNLFFSQSTKENVAKSNKRQAYTFNNISEICTSELWYDIYILHGLLIKQYCYYTV